ALDPQQAVSGERQRAVGARLADRPAGLRGVAREAGLRAALSTARQVRKIAREPEQLELEGEHERVHAAHPPVDRVQSVEQVEEARESAKRPLVRLLLGEESQHRLHPDETHAEAIRVLPCLAVRPDQLRAGDGLELTSTLVEHQLDVAERLEPSSEARLRLSDALRDRAD